MIEEVAVQRKWIGSKFLFLYRNTRNCGHPARLNNGGFRTDKKMTYCSTVELPPTRMATSQGGLDKFMEKAIDGY